MQPLLVHLLFHPASDQARELATYIHSQLNDDAVVPGLRIPTAFFPYDAQGNPPKGNRLDLAKLSFVVPLADAHLAADDNWCRYVGDVWEQCCKPDRRCVPIQLRESAWPLDS